MVIGIGVMVLAALTLVIGGVVAVVRRLPLWGYTWIGTTVMVIVTALMVAADDLPYLVSPVIDMLIMMVLLLGAALGAVGWRGPLLGGLAGLSTTMILSLVVASWASNPPFNRLVVGGLLCLGTMLEELTRTGSPAMKSRGRKLLESLGS